MTFGDSPVGTIHKRTERSAEALSELFSSLSIFLNEAPTATEIEMVDQLISAFTWNYQGYACVFDAAVEAHKIVHKEEPSWQKKRPV